MFLIKLAKETITPELKDGKNILEDKKVYRTQVDRKTVNKFVFSLSLH